MEKIRIADYNMGDYTGVGFDDGSEEGIVAYREVMAKVNADLWAAQTDIPFYGRKNGRSPRKVLFYDWKHYEGVGTWQYNYKAFITNRDITPAERVYYTGELNCYSDGKKQFCHPWFLTSEITVDGKAVRLVNIHVDWADNRVRAEQLRQIREYAKDFEHCIIIGDFNPCDYIDMKAVSDRLTFEEDLAAFIEEGYIPANAGAFGVLNTLPEHKDRAVPCDNILITPNMRYESVSVHTEPWMNDHAILIADIVVE